MGFYPRSPWPYTGHGCPYSIWRLVSLALPAKDESTASRAKSERLQQAQLSSGQFLSQSVGGGSQPKLSVQEDASLQIESQTLYVPNTEEDFSSHSSSAAWLLNESAGLCFVGP